jgi:WD40 repeat protein
MKTAQMFGLRALRALCAITLTAVGLIACGGGGGGGGAAGVTDPGGGGGVPAPSPGPAPGPAGEVQPVINAGVSGKLLMSSPGSYIEFDLATGIERVLRPKAGGYSPSLDGQEFVLTNSRPADLEITDDREELVFFNRDGRSSSRFLVQDGFSGQPRLSPDKQLVMVEWHSIDLGDAGGVSVVTIFRRDGTIVRRFTDYDNQYAWFPNGDILLSRGDSFFRVNPLSNAAPQLIARIPGEAPRAPTLSPDGRRIAFTIGNFTILENTTWIINVDGTGLREVAKIPGNVGGGVAPHSFSPDGQQLLVSEGINFAIVGPGAVAGCAELYVVPLNLNAPIVINPDSPAPAIKLKSLFGEFGTVSDKACAFSNPSWLNIPELPAFTAGTPPQGTGINKGLTGSVWYGFAGDLFRSSLTTGESMRLAKSSNTPFVSYDGTEITLFDRFLPSNVNDEAVLILNANTGAQISRVDYLEGFISPLKLSPDKTKILTGYANLDNGDGGASRIVNVFSRDLSQIFVRYNGVRSWDWLSDGSLLLATLNEVFITDANFRNPTLVAEFSDPIGGVTISRDSTRIAFTMNGNVWTMARDGSGLKQLTETARNLSSPQFSPDGRYVLVDSNDSPYQTWVVSVDGVRVPVLNLLQVNTPAFPLREIRDGNTQLLNASTGVSWR